MEEKIHMIFAGIQITSIKVFARRGTLEMDDNTINKTFQYSNSLN